MTTLMTLVVLLAILTAAYAAGILLLARGLKTSLRDANRRAANPTASVVIAARNEAENIGQCIESVLRNTYDNFELVVVDDGSTDGTPEIVRNVFSAWSESRPRRNIIVSRDSESGHGKVHAIARGIEASTGEIIVTLDADCVVESGWLKAMLRSMEPDVGFVAGPVAYWDSNELLRRVEALEFMSLIGVGAGAIGLGAPLICNSANAAYRRSTYDQMQSSTEIPRLASADELLMQFVHQHTPYRVRFCSSSESVVTTHGAATVGDFLRQRMRWVAMVNHIAPSHRLALALAFLFMALTSIALMSGPWLPTFGLAGLGALSVKTAADYAVLSRVCRHFGRHSLLTVLPVAELLYLPYVLFTAPAGIFRQPEWKGRRVASHASAVESEFNTGVSTE